MQNPVAPAILLEDKSHSLLYRIETIPQEQKTVIKDIGGNIQYTSQLEGENVVIRDSKGNIVKSVPNSGPQPQMPRLKMMNKYLRDLSLPENIFDGIATCSSGPGGVKNMDAGDMVLDGDNTPQYFIDHSQQRYSVGGENMNMPVYNPDFIMNSPSTACCGCVWCGCGDSDGGNTYGSGCQGQVCGDDASSSCDSNCTPSFDTVGRARCKIKCVHECVEHYHYAHICEIISITVCAILAVSTVIGLAHCIIYSGAICAFVFIGIGSACFLNDETQGCMNDCNGCS